MRSPLDRFELLRELAVGGARGDDLTQLCQAALVQAAELVGLQAASLFLFGDGSQAAVNASYAFSENHRSHLQALESELFAQLRGQRQLQSAYLSFGGETPYQTFTLPLRHGAFVFGAVIGLQDGEKRLVAEDDFLEALTALIALTLAARGPGPGEADSEKSKMSGIRETAVTVNHEINSPLTAILGNVQLLLRDKDQLDAKLLAKLKTIEESAERIQRVTKRLLKVQKPRSVEYSDGIWMLDISDDPDAGTK
ncbi:MAG: histidine kinase dimerization/phospho-acceptor domain-containing protein [bacterium]